MPLLSTKYRKQATFCKDSPKLDNKMTGKTLSGLMSLESIDSTCLALLVQVGGVMEWEIFRWHTLGSLGPN